MLLCVLHLHRLLTAGVMAVSDFTSGLEPTAEMETNYNMLVGNLIQHLALLSSSVTQLPERLIRDMERAVQHFRAPG